MSLFLLFTGGAPAAYTGTIYVNGVNDSANWQFTHLQAAISYMASNYPNLTVDNGSGAAGPVHVEISLTSTDTTAVVVSGFTTNAANYLNIYTTAAARPTAFLQSGKYQLTTANGNTLTLNTEYVRVDGLSVNLTGANADFQQAVYSDAVASPSDIRISNCFVTAVGGSFRAAGIALFDNSITLYLWNCAVIASGASNAYSSAIVLGTGTASVYSCTLIGTHSGFNNTNGNPVALKNTYCYGPDHNDIYDSGSGGITQTTNATADTTATGTALDSIAYSTSTFYNVTAGTQDFRPALGSALAGVGAGTNTSGESAPLNFTTDILGTTRTAWNVGAYMAGSTVYVDGVNNAPTRQFTTLQAAITHMVANFPVLTTNNGSGGAGPLHIEISVTGSEGQTIVNGFTTSSTAYVNIYTTAAARHAGVWSTSKYRIEAANVTGALAIRDDHVRLDGLQVNLTGANANFQGALMYNDGFITATNEFRLSNCIVKATGSGFRVHGIALEDSSITGMTIWNCIAYVVGAEDHSVSTALLFSNAGVVSVYSCTLVGVGSGAGNFGAVAVTIKNCYVAGTGSASTDFHVGGGGGTFTQTNCATADTSASGTAPQDSIPYSTATFTSVTAGSEDFHLVVGSDLLDAGTDTSGESAPLNFTTDIAGVARTGTWEIGALLEAVAAPSVDITLFEDGLFRRVFARQFARVS